MVMAVAVFFGMGGTGHLYFIGIKRTQLRFIGFQEHTNYNSNNENNEGYKGFLHVWAISILFTQRLTEDRR
jgi:hypothetical protein